MIAASVIAATSVFAFFSIEGNRLEWEYQDDGSLFRFHWHDHVWDVDDCSTEQLHCLSDESGFEITLPKDKSVRRWSTDTSDYQVITHLQPFVSEAPPRWIIDRITSSGQRIRYHFIDGCGLSAAQLRVDHIIWNAVGPTTSGLRAFHAETCGFLEHWSR